jgi:hypothetical protein
VGFTRGLKIFLKLQGCVALEFHHVTPLMGNVAFDSVCHEHFSYLSLHVVCEILKVAGLRVWEVEKLSTQGGSLRVYGCHRRGVRPTSPVVDEILAEEASFGLQDLALYRNFQSKVDKVKDDFLSFLIKKKNAGSRVAAYGAAAKGNTLLNYAGVKRDLLPYVCDAAQSRQGKFLPGSHIPVLSPEI